MAIEDKINHFKSQFNNQMTWEAKYEKIIELGKAWTGLDVSLQTDDLKVKGCQSQVWIKAELKDDKKIYFSGDSDALLVKGLVAMILTIYSGETPETILKYEPTFLKDVGFDKGLSPSRSNGLYSMVKQIKYYATAFQYLLSK